MPLSEVVVSAGIMTMIATIQPGLKPMKLLTMILPHVHIIAVLLLCTVPLQRN